MLQYILYMSQYTNIYYVDLVFSLCRPGIFNHKKNLGKIKA